MDWIGWLVGCWTERPRWERLYVLRTPALAQSGPAGYCLRGDRLCRSYVDKYVCVWHVVWAAGNENGQELTSAHGTTATSLLGLEGRLVIALQGIEHDAVSGSSIKPTR